MNLSRPILKALTSLSFHTPTPIQAATIPVALLGKDIVGNAVTGSGKTAAFIIPMLERLLYREKGKKAAATRCLILVPTRELAVQCFEVGKKLSAHTDVRFALIAGGLSLKAQESTLRTRPDVVIATPGRLIDHLRNSMSFNLDALDILVLDEADRMLSEGFTDELTEIVRSCPTSRQTMLFSATMTDSIDELVRMSLDKPVRLFVDPKRTTARGLVQEFVRVRGWKRERPRCSPHHRLQADVQGAGDHLLSQQETRASNASPIRSIGHAIRGAPRGPYPRAALEGTPVFQGWQS
jgi:ATP-dependent RNA helicase DDX27